MSRWLWGNYGRSVPFQAQFLRHRCYSCAQRFTKKPGALVAIIRGEMMTTSEESLPDAEHTRSTVSDAAVAARTDKWVRIAFCVGGVIFGIPFLGAIILIGWILVKHFFATH